MQQRLCDARVHRVLLVVDLLGTQTVGTDVYRSHNWPVVVDQGGIVIVEEVVVGTKEDQKTADTVGVQEVLETGADWNTERRWGMPDCRVVHYSVGEDVRRHHTVAVINLLHSGSEMHQDYLRVSVVAHMGPVPLDGHGTRRRVCHHSLLQ